MNNGFERGALEAGRSMPLEWLLGVPDGASYLRSTEIAHSGPGICVHPGQRGDASYFATPIDTRVSRPRLPRCGLGPGHRRERETNIAIAWYEATASSSASTRSRHIAVGTTDWRRLIVAGSPPPGGRELPRVPQVGGQPGTACFDDVAAGLTAAG